MNVQIQSRNLRVTENLRSIIERQANKVRKLLPTFAAEDLDIRVSLEKLSKGKQFHTSLLLNLPQRAIHVEEIEDNIVSSTLKAFTELTRRIKKFKSQLSRERYLQKEQARTVDSPAAPDLSDELHQHLDRIENYLRREIYHNAVLQGMAADGLQPHALVDQVFLEASATSPVRPPSVSPEQWVFQVARRILSEKLAEAGDPSSLSAEGGGGDELDSFLPDEYRSLESLLRDIQGDTHEEKYLASQEAELFLQKAIAELPGAVRESYVLFAMEGFNSEETAKITGREPQEVLDHVEEARQRLRETLGQETAG